MEITTEYILKSQSSKDKVPMIVAFGGGMNSTAMLIGMQQQSIKPDLILFADTGGELPETYEHVRHFADWLQARGLPEIIWVSKTFAGEPTSLEADCLRNKTLPSIAFGWKGCSIKYKRDPQDKYCNNWPPAREAWLRGSKCLKAIGYDAGEERRARLSEDEKYQYWYPMIEWGWWREECAKICQAEGFSPPKSACFFCPNASKAEVLKLKQTHPNLLHRALSLEANAELTTIKGLGRGQFAWRDLIGADAQQQKLICEVADDMPCGCYDGA